MLFSCGNSLEEVNEMIENNTPLGEVSENVTLYFSDNGKPKIKLEAPILNKVAVEEKKEIDKETVEKGKKKGKRKVAMSSNLICPEGMLVTFYDSLGIEESQLYAKYGKMISETQYLLVRDSVVFTNINDEKLETELLHIYFNKDSITTPEPVTITTGEGIIKGVGLTSNTGFTKYQLDKITESHYNLKDSEKKEK